LLSNNTGLYSHGGHLSTAVLHKPPFFLSFRYFDRIRSDSGCTSGHFHEKTFFTFCHLPPFFPKIIALLSIL